MFKKILPTNNNKARKSQNSILQFMGKREIGQLSLFDLIIILSIADLMVLGIDGFDKDILYSIIPMIIVAVTFLVAGVVSVVL